MCLAAEKPSASRMTSPQMSYPSPTSRTKMRALSEVSQDDYSAKIAAAMLDRRRIGSQSRSVSQQLSPAHRKQGSSAVTSAPEAAAQRVKGSSRGRPVAYQLASPGRDCDRPSAAGPQQANTGNRNDVISLMSSVETTRAEELSGDDESDDEVTMMSHSLGGTPAAGASTQPIAASSAPAVKHELVSDSGDADITLESSDDEAAPSGQLPAAGRAVSSTQPSSAVRASSSMPSKGKPLQVPDRCITCRAQASFVTIYADCKSPPLCPLRPSACLLHFFCVLQTSVPQPYPWLKSLTTLFDCAIM